MKVAEEMPLLGHRNWILIVDSAYPLQTSPGVETIETNESQEEVVKSVLQTIDRSIQVRPMIFMDAELPEVPDSDAPGVSKYRAKIAAILHGLPITSLPHEQIIGNIDEAGKTFSCPRAEDDNNDPVYVGVHSPGQQVLGRRCGSEAAQPNGKYQSPIGEAPVMRQLVTLSASRGQRLLDSSVEVAH